MAWPTVDKSYIENGWRKLTDEEASGVDARIEEAEAKLQWQLEQRGITAPVDRPQWATLYKSTIAEMVRRYFANPDGILEETFRVDDYSETRRRDKNTSSGKVFVSEEEVDALIPRRTRRRGAFSIRTV